MSREIYKRSVAPHNARVAGDAGIPSDNVQAAIMLMQDMQPDIDAGRVRLFYSPELTGSKIRTSAPYLFATKGYSANEPQAGIGNDLTQTTANSQPYLDKIAPSEPWGLKNTNGDSRFMSHPAISFLDSDRWTYEIVVDMQGAVDADIISRLTIDATNNGSQIRKQGSGWIFANQNVVVTNISGSVANTHSLHGKKKIIHFVANGNGTLGIYYDGIHQVTANINGGTTFNFNNIRLTGGGINHLRAIFADALTAQRIATRAALLRSIFPEIPTVRIAWLDVAVRALDIVCTPAGTVIANVTDNAAWAALTTAAWCHHSNDLALGSVYGKQYNGFARDLLNADLASSNFGYHIATKAEWNIILEAGANNLKALGTNYWTTANGTNLTGLTILGGGSRDAATGLFNSVKGTVRYWCADVDERVLISDDGTTSFVAAGKSSGFYILLIKNY